MLICQNAERVHGKKRLGTPALGGIEIRRWGIQQGWEVTVSQVLIL